MPPRSDALDPRTAVLVGGGQLSHRVDRGATPMEPVELMAEAARRAAADTGAAAGEVLAAVDTVAIVQIFSWRYRDPAALVAERIGAPVRRTIHTATGGNMPQALVNRACLDIESGRADAVLIGGAEAWRTRSAARAAGEHPAWTVQDDTVAPSEVLGHDGPLGHPAETACGLVAPVQHYPLFESVLRARAGRSHAEHLAHLSRLWAGFSEVASTNPHAWIQERFSAEQLATVDPGNRMVGFPYPKRLNSNNAVEQGAAVLVCSAERARRLGIAPERWVFPHAGTDAHDTLFVSNRPDLGGSPAIRVAGRRALALAGVGPDDLAHLDVYSCFPSAVQVAAAELGFGLDRRLTVTGGLSFAGGPWNDYVTHALATMVGVLRDDPGSRGLVTANGGFLTKHAFGVYSTEPPAGGFRYDEPQAEVDAAGSVDLAEGATGPATVEAYTVMHDREGAPERAFAAVRLADGRRAWSTSTDAGVLAEMLATEVVGRSADLTAEASLSLR
ncbi:MAG: acetyl-CoA acetyltransferase [Actinobacteria bacterium]|nr:acetyl-CoA acetyltransferase [Actinomycetota bacterium]